MKRSIIAVLAVAALLLTGCSTVTTTGAATSTRASESPSASSSLSASASPTPVAKSAALVIGAGEVSYENAGSTQTATYRKGAELVALVRSIAAAEPVRQNIAGTTSVRYTWGGTSVVVAENDRANIATTDATLNGVSIRTADGISVGGTRAAAEAAGGENVHDEDGDGTVDHIGVDSQPAPGTTSLAHPDREGIDFVLLQVDAATIVQIQAPANDYSDI